VAEDARFCAQCGTSLSDAGAAPATPDERKVVTVLFADMAGSTALGERLDPERLRALNQSYFDAMRTEIEAEGGTVEKYIGDAVMAAFGVPVAHEDDPARALRAALRMQRRVTELNEEFNRVHGVELAIRIGVNTGDVLATGSPQVGEALVTGDPVNVAARFEQAAGPGQVVTGERTMNAVRGFRCRLIGDLELKGKSQPMPAFLVLGEDEARPDRGIPGLRAPMVGRDPEIDLLRSIYSRTAGEGRAHLVTIYGEAGVGKSRLTAEFLNWAQQQQPTPRIVQGRCLPYGDGVTYWPLAEIAKREAGVLDSDSSELALGKLQEIGRTLLNCDLVADPMRTASALAYTMGLVEPNSPLTSMDGRQVRVEVEDAWRAFFTCLAVDAPLVVVVDDIHWADPALLDLLDGLTDHVTGGVVLICPARPELAANRPGWGGARRNMSAIGLDPLSAADAARLMNALVEIQDLPESVRTQILERAEGNPFFLEEIVRHLIDLGQVISDAGGWRAVPGIDLVELPDTVHGVLASRIDLLPPASKRVLQAAAVVGRTFWPGALMTGLGDDGTRLDVSGSLAELVDREFVRPRPGSSLAGENELIFKHVLTRDVAYGSLPRAERARSHAATAEWLQNLAGGRRREFSDFLAHHWHEAYLNGREDVAIDAGWLEKVRLNAMESAAAAARQSLACFVLDKAASMAERSVSLTHSIVERASALELLGEVRRAEYRGDAAWRAFREAADLRQQLDTDPTALAQACASAATIPLRWPGSMSKIPPAAEALHYVRLGTAHLPPGDSREAVQLLTLTAFLGGWGVAARELEGTPTYEEAEAAGYAGYEMALRLGDAALASAALDGASSPAIDRGYYGDAAQIDALRLALVPQLEGQVWELGDIYSVSAWTHLQRGEPDLAAQRVDEFRELLGDASAEGVLIHALAWRVAAQYLLGDWDEVTKHSGPELVRILGDRLTAPPGFSLVGLSHLALVHAGRGDLDAVPDLMAGLEQDENVGSGTRNSGLARIELMAGRVDHARTLLEQIDPAVAGVSRPMASAVWADMLGDAGDWEAVGTFVADETAYAERARTRLLPPYLRRLTGRRALANGEPDVARADLTTAIAGFEQIPVPWDVARTQVFLADAFHATGDDVSARRCLDAALPTFQRLRSVADLAGVRERYGGLG